MAEKIKGMYTCDVCGRDFPLLAEEVYMARDAERSGITVAIVGDMESKLYDAIDCPHCGCQNILQERKRYWIPEDMRAHESDCPCEGGCEHHAVQE